MRTVIGHSSGSAGVTDAPRPWHPPRRNGTYDDTGSSAGYPSPPCGAGPQAEELRRELAVLNSSDVELEVLPLSRGRRDGQGPLDQRRVRVLGSAEAERRELSRLERGNDTLPWRHAEDRERLVNVDALAHNGVVYFNWAYQRVKNRMAGSVFTARPAASRRPPESERGADRRARAAEASRREGVRFHQAPFGSPEGTNS